MGAKLFGLRGQLNDNVKPAKGDLDKVPISPEDWRHPPTIKAEPGVRWFCLVTVPQAEYRCADALNASGVAAYVPTSTQWVRRRKGREMVRVQTQTPMFRGYVFARLSEPMRQDTNLGQMLRFAPDWDPIFATGAVRMPDSDLPQGDAYAAAFRLAESRASDQRSRIGVLGVIGASGVPRAIPGNALGAIADEEREGWFDDARRPSLIAGRDAKPEPDVRAGEVVLITGGPFAGHQAVAENDNIKETVRLSATIFGQATLMTIGLQDLENLTRPKLAGAALRRA